MGNLTLAEQQANMATYIPRMAKAQDTLPPGKIEPDSCEYELPTTPLASNVTRAEPGHHTGKRRLQAGAPSR